LIKSLAIKNFKVFLNLEIGKVAPITLFGGKNNIGKTSILEAIFLYYDRLNPASFLRHFHFRGVPSVVMQPESLWAPIFWMYDMKNPIVISLNNNGETEEVSFTFNPNYKRLINLPQTNLSSKVPSVRTDEIKFTTSALEIKYKKGNIELFLGNIVFNDSGIVVEPLPPILNSKEPQAIFLAARTAINPNEEATRFGRIDLNGKLDLVVNVLQIIDSRIKSLSSIMEGDTSLIYADIGIGRKLPLKLLGDGVARLFSIILAIADASSGVVLIDEIENGIHYSVMPKVWEGIAKAAKEFNCQIFATTHSYECLQSVYDGLKDFSNNDDFSYIRFERENNDIIAQIYDFELLGAAIEANMEVR